MAKVAVLTFPMKSKDGQIRTCNMVEGLDITMGRIKERFEDFDASRQRILTYQELTELLDWWYL